MHTIVCAYVHDTFSIMPPNPPSLYTVAKSVHKCTYYTKFWNRLVVGHRGEGHSVIDGYATNISGYSEYYPDILWILQEQ